MPTDFDFFHYSTWSVDFAQVDGAPVILPRFEWDEKIGGKGTVLVDPHGGLYKAWYISQPSIDYTGYKRSEGVGCAIAYATSMRHHLVPLIGVV